MTFPAAIAEALPSLCLRFGAAGGTPLRPGLPVLAGAVTEDLFPAAQPAGRSGAFTLATAPDYLVGHAEAPAGEAIEESAYALYRELAELTAGWALARVWNTVPRINAPRADGLEFYRAFCSGRARAYEAAWGADFKRRIPAASAVGSDAEELGVVFVATRQDVAHVENPVQVPAYQYPAAYGPRPPSFARATVVALPGGRRDVFISGTSAIRGYRTLTPGDTARQLACTVENLQGIGAAAGLGAVLGAPGEVERHVRVYLRHAADLPTVAAVLDRDLLRPTDRVSYVRADICRADLNVEIELTVFAAAKTE
ncbi:pteridine-dependent deoxygenase like protein [Opitutus sp. ER46]|uniref:chorismate transformation enzyme, FkbO/Hyg5 family n=1 Tax=Opitutus sp. ER46 TaxID=2161864 RepID=UPI0011B1E77D|nr:pteridine-dependent deoxygenase like protein [Opitutus sp. ER46]